MAYTQFRISEDGARPIHGRERRAVALRASATRSDASVVELTITDLSHNGCGVECPAQLVAGERLVLDVAGRGKAPAHVRWADGGRAGLAFISAAPEPAVTDQVERRSERVSVSAEVALRRAGKLHFQVRVFDVSPDGCKAEFVDRPELHEHLWIRFPGMEALEASVRWIAGPCAGLQFARPIHQAVFDLMLARLRN